MQMSYLPSLSLTLMHCSSTRSFLRAHRTWKPAYVSPMPTIPLLNVQQFMAGAASCINRRADVMSPLYKWVFIEGSFNLYRYKEVKISGLIQSVACLAGVRPSDRPSPRQAAKHRSI